MADYDFSKPAPDRSHRIPKNSGSGAGGIGLVAAGAVIVLAVLYGIFGGTGVPNDQSPSDSAPSIVAPVD